MGINDVINKLSIGVFPDLISDVIFTNLHDNKQILGWQ
jgi:hypothetical protein